MNAQRSVPWVPTAVCPTGPADISENNNNDKDNMNNNNNNNINDNDNNNHNNDTVDLEPVGHPSRSHAPLFPE